MPSSRAQAEIPNSLTSLAHATSDLSIHSGRSVQPAKVASEALGHSSVAFTMDTYQHILLTMGEQVAAAIETGLGGDRG